MQSMPFDTKLWLFLTLIKLYVAKFVTTFAADCWFSWGTLVDSTSKNGFHDITEIL